VQLLAVRRLQEYFLYRGEAPGDIGAARLRQRLPVEDQRILREVDDQRQPEGDRGNDLEDGRDQVL